jgi:hypothetical protein
MPHPLSLELIMKKLIPLIAALFCSGFAQAADTPATPQAWAQKMTDPTQNASAFKDPAVFAQWSAAMMNPATSVAMMQQAMDPNAYARMLSGMMNPASMQNYMQLMDPAVSMKWLGAAMDPRFYTAMLGQGLNPATYMNWMTLPTNPQMLGLGMQMLNPGMYANMMAAPLNPAMMNAMMTPMNPNTYMNWLGAGLNPATYGSWGNLMTMPAAPGLPMALPVDPAALLKMMPAMPAPAK